MQNVDVSLVISSSLVIGILLLGGFWFNWRKTKMLQDKLQRLDRELKASCAASIGMGQQIITLEKLVRQQASQTDKFSVEQHFEQPAEQQADPRSENVHSATSNDSSDSESLHHEDTFNHSVSSRADYDEARQALAAGQSISAVSKAFGLSYAEVSLLQAMSVELKS